MVGSGGERSDAEPSPRKTVRLAAVGSLRIGVLAVQGDFEAHARVLARLGAEPVEVRRADQLAAVDGLIIPGGESTTISKGLAEYGLVAPLRDGLAGGLPVLGTCAGLIVLSRDHLGLLDVAVERNAYGRQIHSFEAALEVCSADVALRGDGGPLTGVFIRAPLITDLGSGVEVLVTLDGFPVAVRQGSVVACAFHPELTGDSRLHELFLNTVRIAKRSGDAGAPAAGDARTTGNARRFE